MDAFTESVMYKAFVNIQQSTSTWNKVTHGDRDAQTNQSRCLLTSREGHKATGIQERTHLDLTLILLMWRMW